MPDRNAGMGPRMLGDKYVKPEGEAALKTMGFGSRMLDTPEAAKPLDTRKAPDPEDPRTAEVRAAVEKALTDLGFRHLSEGEVEQVVGAMREQSLREGGATGVASTEIAQDRVGTPTTPHPDASGDEGLIATLRGEEEAQRRSQGQVVEPPPLQPDARGYSVAEVETLLGTAPDRAVELFKLELDRPDGPRKGAVRLMLKAATTGETHASDVAVTAMQDTLTLLEKR